MSKPKLRIFAGPNGSGKSTLFDAIKNEYFSTQIFINADLLEQQFNKENYIDLKEFDIISSEQEFEKFINQSGLYKKANFDINSWNLTLINNIVVKKDLNSQKPYTSYHFAILADFIRHQLIKNNISFSFETVFSHSSKLDFIKLAQEKGYKTYLYFIGTNTPIINQERILDRVKKGGHAVDNEKITNRYHRTMNLLFDMIKLVDESYLWDNSKSKQEFIASSKSNSIKFFKVSIPVWVHHYLIEKILSSK